MYYKLFLPLILFALLFTACEQKPLPSDKLDYVGKWKGTLNNETMHIVIGKDSSLSYIRKKERDGFSSSSSVNAPIQEFKGDNFVAGVLIWDTEFVVSQAPKKVNGTWTMTVDGVELTRK